jgi:hypothetical protein
MANGIAPTYTDNDDKQGPPRAHPEQRRGVVLRDDPPAAPAFRTDVMNAGRTARIISEEKSLNRLVRPSRKMFFWRPRIFSCR